MQTPPEIIFHEVPRSDWSEALIRERIARLERFADDIVSCLVTVSQPHRHQHKGKPFRVVIDIHLPRSRRLTVVEEPAVVERQTDLRSDLRATLDAAFSAMEGRLRAGAGESRRRDALTPADEEWRGLVVRLFPDTASGEEGYGFLRTPDGEEFYFHRNGVLHGDYARLAVGTEVRFTAYQGEAGPQASSLQIVNKPGERESEATRERDDIPPGWRNAEER